MHKKAYNSNQPTNMRYSARFARRKPQKQTTSNNKKQYKARFSRRKPQKQTTSNNKKQYKARFARHHHTKLLYKARFARQKQHTQKEGVWGNLGSPN